MTKTYAMALEVPPRRHFTAGKWYEVVDTWGGDGDPMVQNDRGRRCALCWHQCSYLNGSGWLRYDGDEAPPDWWTPDGLDPALWGDLQSAMKVPTDNEGDAHLKISTKLPPVKWRSAGSGPKSPAPEWDVYISAKTPWHEMPKGQQDAIKAAIKNGAEVEWLDVNEGIWCKEDQSAEWWEIVPRRIRLGSVPLPDAPTLDLSNRASQTFDMLPPEVQAGLQALPIGETEWKEIATGRWVPNEYDELFPGGTYRQKPGPVTIHYPTIPEGEYVHNDGTKIIITRNKETDK